MNSTSQLPRRPRGRPARNGLDYADTRTLLIRRGTEMLTQRGVSATGLDELLKSVSVPKGSFYHYFDSKDAFVAATIAAYADYFARKLDRHFLQPDISPLNRISAFVDEACAGVERHNFSRGCLVGNLGQEADSLNESLRQSLESVFCDWEARLSHCLHAAIAAGEISATVDCPALAHAFWIGWEGAILRTRLSRSTTPMRAFFKLFLSALPRP